jgi:hypothetical protein
MHIPDHFSKRLETVFGVKNTQILRCGSGSVIRIWDLFDPGSGMKNYDDKHRGSATLEKIGFGSGYRGLE